MSKPNQSKLNLFNKTDNIIISVIVVISIILLILFNLGSKENLKAEITIEGTLVSAIELSSAQNGISDITDSVSYEIKDGAIRFYESDCKDKICINSGWLDKEGGTAICLPNRITIRVLGNNNGIDGVVN